ncbi:MAG: alpha/beta hydrolase [Alphaproteobacteria bacterium]|nr:alpha/beta hydrolase [Alphaproteobacteria bacterium]
MHSLFKLLILLPALALAACGGLFFYPQQELLLTPDRAGLAYKEVRFAASDGVRLHGWYLPADPQAAREPTCTVLFLHGNAENISTHLGSVWWLPARGVNVFLFDYRGYGRSEGTPDLDGLHRDFDAALKVALDRGNSDPGRIVVFGQSLGGALAVTAVARSAHKDQLRGLIIEGAFSGYRAIVRDKLASSWLTWPLQWPLSYTVDDDYKPLQAIGRLSPLPVLVVHGLADGIIPPHHAKALYDAARTPKTLWRIPGAAHIAAFRTKKNQDRLIEYLRGLGCAAQ